MGSLMAGWGSPSLDPKSATLKRNRSLTKEEIDAYWRTKKEIEEEHLRAISNLSESSQASRYKKSSQKKLQKSTTMPIVRMKEPLDKYIDTSLEQLMKKTCWWTKSSWAFLNEPPVIEAASNKYASQFHAANLGSTNFNPRGGISAGFESALDPLTVCPPVTMSV